MREERQASSTPFNKVLNWDTTAEEEECLPEEKGE